MGSHHRYGDPEEGRARILQAARERYLSGQRIELAQLAAEQGISRATAYRWVGDNDRLMAEVLAERIKKTFARELNKSIEKTGRERVLQVVEQFLHHATASRHLEVLLTHERRRLIKIMTTSTHRMQPMIVDLFEELISKEHGIGHLNLTVPARTLAYGIVRFIEAYLYADVVAGDKRDIGTTIQLIGLLMPDHTSHICQTTP